MAALVAVSRAQIPADAECSAACGEPLSSPRNIRCHFNIVNGTPTDQKVHHIHIDCLNRWARQNNTLTPTCPTCRAPLDASSIIPLKDRFIQWIRAGVLVGKEFARLISLIFALVAGAGTVSSICFGAVYLLGASLAGFPLSFVLQGPILGSFAGALLSGAANAVVGGTILFLGERLIERLNPREPIFFKIAFFAIAVISTIWTQVLVSQALKARLLAPLTSGAQQVFLECWEKAPRYRDFTGFSRVDFLAGGLVYERFVSFVLTQTCAAIAIPLTALAEQN